jgi:hypothetical protein
VTVSGVVEIDGIGGGEMTLHLSISPQIKLKL